MFKLLCFLVSMSCFVKVDPKLCHSQDVRVYMQNFEEKLRNCTVIVGYLQIVLFDLKTEADFRNVSFPELEEITGYLLFFQVSGLTSIGQLFPNLRIIRGQMLFLDYALVIYRLADLKQVGLTNLRYIARGSTRIGSCPRLCYVDTIDWSQIGGQLHYFNENVHECPCPERCGGYCWNEEVCQAKKLPKCHAECLDCVGDGPDSENCKVCKNFSYNGTCVSKCPPGTFESRLVSMCITMEECNNLTNGTFVFENKCMDTCPKNYQKVTNETGHFCEHCGEYCKKNCSATSINTISLLQQMKGCTHINGSLSLTVDKNSQEMVQELEESLGDIQEIKGYLKIQHTYHIKSLSFLRNLRKIHGIGLGERMPSLIVVNNKDLRELFNWETTKLEMISGNISFHYNPQLCLAEIEKLANHTNTTHSFDNKIDVSPFSNGDEANCSTVNTTVWVVENATSATLTWNHIDVAENIIRMGYFVYYMEDVGGDITLYDNRDACNVKMWNTVLVPSNTATLTGLKPFTGYAYYIKMLTTESVMRSQTQINNFTTLSDDPSLPENVKFVSTKSDTVKLTWSPPKFPNGKLEKYILIGYAQLDDLEALDNRNYCIKTNIRGPPKHDFTTSETSEVAVEKENGTCSCNKEVHVAIKPSLDNLCYSYVNVFTGSGISDACKQFKYEVIDLNATQFDHQISHHSIYKRTGETKPRDIEETIPANATSFEITNLQHFTLYVFLFSACNEQRRGNSKMQCSEIYMDSIRTLKNNMADDIPPGVRVEVYNNDTLISWDEPPKPNSLILTYLIEHVRTDIENANPSSVCITRKQHVENGYEYWIKNLVPGKYAVKIRATSSAGPGRFTEYQQFEIKAPSNISVGIIVGLLIGFIVITAVSVAYVYYYFKRKHELDNMHLITSVNTNYAGTVYVEDEWELLRSDVEILKELGQGTFGMVYSGQILSKKIPCAIKTVNENANVHDRMEFLNEASVMKSFQEGHHVVKLLGVVSRGQPPLVVMELMARGDLKSFLRLSRESSQNITCVEMYRMAAEIADGMAYLVSKKFIHRDLAARNCMVSADHTVKIGDFGMARDIYENDYYRKESKGLLPVRWMAPESLADGVFTSDSDVWSYGVVLWEMVTLAEQPYQGLANEQVLQFVVARGTLERPLECPDLLYEIMEACWKWKPISRPMFTDIVEKLESHIGQDFKLVSFYHSREGEEYRMNIRERVYNPPALSVPAESDAFVHWNGSDDEISLYSGEPSRPNRFLSFTHQRQSRPSSNYHLENNSPQNGYTYSLGSM